MRDKDVEHDVLRRVLREEAVVAEHGAAAEDVSIRVAERRGSVYLDLADGRVVEATAAGWNITAPPDVHFYRPSAMSPLPEPQRGGSVDELKSILRVGDADWPLVLGWLLGAFMERGHHFALVVQGPRVGGRARCVATCSAWSTRTPRTT